jgi:hypothetical protein
MTTQPTPEQAAATFAAAEAKWSARVDELTANCGRRWTNNENTNL